MAEPNEDKQTNLDSKIDQDVDTKLAEIETERMGKEEAASDSSTEKDSTDETKDALPDKDKTDTSETSDFEGVPKGFASHPAWQKLNQKAQAAEQRAKDLEVKSKELERQAAQSASLLNDPDIYKKYLQRQGFSDHEIKQKMSERGFSVSDDKKEPLFNRVARKIYGDDFARLKPEEQDYLKDLVRVMEVTHSELMGDQLTPIQSKIAIQEKREAVDMELDDVEEMCAEDGIDFEKEALPMMGRILKSMQEKDPRFVKNPPSALNTLYPATFRAIKREKDALKDRQGERDERKKNAKPLTSGGGLSKDGKTPKKIKTDKDIDDAVDEILDNAGVGRF